MDISIADISRLLNSDPHEEAAIAFADAHDIEMPRDEPERGQWIADNWDRIEAWGL